jgi:RND family efflux transporter MFP subunit
MSTSAKSASEVSLDALRKGKKQRLVTWLVLGGISAAGLAAYMLFKPLATAEILVVKRDRAVAAVYGTVLVEPTKETLVRAQSSGIISGVQVKKGDAIKEGDLLVEITDDSFREQIKAAQTSYDNATKAREIGPATFPALEAAKRELEQIKKLVDEGNLARLEYSNKQSAYKTLEDRVKNETLVLDAAIEQAKQRLEAARSLDTKRFVKAPQNGVIMDFYSQLGQVITTQEQIFLIGSQESHIRAQVNEEDVGGLKDGMSAIVRLYSYPGQDFEAKLREILPRGQNQEYSVILTLVTPPERLLPGMTGELNIIIGERENVIVIPTRAIRSGLRPSVLLVDEEGIVRSREVTTGYRSIEKVEISSGLKEGEKIVLGDHDLLRPGQKVTARVLP